MCLVVTLAEGGGSLCHCEPVVVVLSNEVLTLTGLVDNFKVVMRALV